MENDEINLSSFLPATTLKEIGSYLLEGLTTDEACVLASVDHARFKEFLKTNTVLQTFINKKNIEFKQKHLREIQGKRSDKTSMWMLENLRPEEFGSKKKTGDTTINIVGAILKDIQQSNDMLPVKGHFLEDKGQNNDYKGQNITVRDALV